MAKANKETIVEIKAMIDAQQNVEHRWYSVKHLISDTDLKDPIAAALASTTGRLQALADSFSD